MNVGLIIYGSLDTRSGGYLYDRKLVEYLRAQGDAVEIISLPWRNYAAHLTDNLWFRLPHASAKTNAVADGDFDILIQDELNHPSLIAANRGKHPYSVLSLVHHLRCSEPRPAWQNAFYRWVEKRYLHSVDGFICNSRTTEKAVRSLGNTQKPGIVAYPPTDRFGAPISEEAIRHRAQTDRLRILFLGNVIYRKGLHTLLEAVRELGSRVRVDVAGGLDAEPVYAKQMQSFLEHNGLSPVVFFHGSLDQELLQEKLRAAHVLVVPSGYEGFGIVYLEGMCFGLPAIGTTAGAAPEVIEDGRTGFLIEPGDSKSLASHLRSLAEDRSLLTRLSLQARERYLQRPSWHETATAIRAFLHRMANCSQ
jgi:glycosyltransferase involved in cell wall biosynthesis